MAKHNFHPGLWKPNLKPLTKHPTARTSRAANCRAFTKHSAASSFLTEAKSLKPVIPVVLSDLYLPGLSLLLFFRLCNKHVVDLEHLPAARSHRAGISIISNQRGTFTWPLPEQVLATFILWSCNWWIILPWLSSLMLLYLFRYFLGSED